MKKALFTIFVLITMFCACYSAELYTIDVYATNNTIDAKNVNNTPVTLYVCKSENGEKILLENVTPGNKYRVLLDTCETFNTEDDAILRIKRIGR